MGTVVRYERPEAPLSWRAMRDMPVAIVIVDPWRPDQPIVYVNRAFTRITGYTAAMAVGRNCRFLQGPGTDEDAVARLREAIAAMDEITVELLNYRADGSSFMNRLLVAPVFDEKGQATHLLGVQTEMTGEADEAELSASIAENLVELQQRLRVNLAAVFELIREQAMENDELARKVLASRMIALSVLYEDFVESGFVQGNALDLGVYVSRLASALNTQEGRPLVRLNLAVAPLAIGVDDAVRVGFLLCEVLAHAFDGHFAVDDTGAIWVSLAERADAVCLSVSDTGVELLEQQWPDQRTLGGRIVVALLNQLRAELDVSAGDGAQKTKVAITFDRPRSANLQHLQGELN